MENILHRVRGGLERIREELKLIDEFYDACPHARCTECELFRGPGCERAPRQAKSVWRKAA